MRKIRRLILHIGTGKTGSTSIQDSLGHARDALLEKNIYYPSNKPFNHIFTFVPIFLEDPEKSFVFRRNLLQSEDKRIKVNNFRKGWLKEIKACNKDNFIISAEDFTLPFFKVDSVTRLKKFAEEYFKEVTIIAYVRHYDQWIPSQMQQAVKNGAVKDIREIADFFLNCPPLISYRKNLRKWIKVFGRENIVIRPFDPHVFYNGSLLADFFQACGLPADDISIPEIRSNEAIGKYAVAFLQKYNRTYPVFIEGSANPERGLGQTGTPAYLFNDLKDEKFKPILIYSAEQAEKINKEIDFVNRFFTDGYRFHHVSPGRGEMVLPTTGDIPVEFYVELINNYNKRIETLHQKLNVLKIPFLFHIFERLPFIRTILQNIANNNK